MALASRAPEQFSPAAATPARHASLFLLFLSAAVALPHLLLGPNFVLDDWFNVQQGIVGGPFNAAPTELVESRPGLLIAYGLTFGLFGSHPLPIVLIASLVNMASAQVLFRTASAFVPSGPALAVSGLWVVLPNHMSLEVWPSTIMISMSLLLALTSIWLMAQSDSNRAAILIFAFASSAFYEGSLPLLCLAMLAVPKLKHGALDVRLLAGGALSQGALALWIFSHLPPSKAARDIIAPRDVIASFYGLSIVPEWFEPVAIAGFFVAFALLAFVAVKQRRFELPERLVASGFVIMAVGITPYLRYFYAPLGPGDRVTYLSSIGGAATIVGLCLAATRSAKVLPLLRIGVACGLILVCATRVEGTLAWNRAGDDGVRIIQAIERSDVDPLQPIVLGPEPIYRRGVTPFLDPSNVRPAVEVLFDQPGASGFMTFSEKSFLEEPAAQRVDLREVLDSP